MTLLCRNENTSIGSSRARHDNLVDYPASCCLYETACYYIRANMCVGVSWVTDMIRPRTDLPMHLTYSIGYKLCNEFFATFRRRWGWEGGNRSHRFLSRNAISKIHRGLQRSPGTSRRCHLALGNAQTQPRPSLTCCRLVADIQ